MAIYLSLCCVLAPACSTHQPSEASGALSQAIESSDEELDDVSITGELTDGEIGGDDVIVADVAPPEIPDLDVLIDEVQADVDASLAACAELVASLAAYEEAAEGDEPAVLCLTQAPVDGGSLIIDASIDLDDGSSTIDGTTGGGDGSSTIDGGTGGDDGSSTIDGTTGGDGGSSTIDDGTGGGDGEPVREDQRAPVCAPDDPRQMERTQLEAALKNIDAEITAAEARQKAAQTALAAAEYQATAGVGRPDELDAATIAVAKANAALGRLKVQKNLLLPAKLALNANPKDKDALRNHAQANVDIAKLNVAEAAALHKATRSARDRAAMALEKGAGTRLALEQAEADYQTAKAAEESATTNLRTATEQLDALPRP